MMKYQSLQNLTFACVAGLIGAISIQSATYGMGLTTTVDNLGGGTITIPKDTELTSWQFVNKTGVAWTDFHWFFSDSSQKPILVNVGGELKSEYEIYFSPTFYIKPGNIFDGVTNPKKWNFSTGDTIVSYAPSYELASVPEPTTILGLVLISASGGFLSKKYTRKFNKQAVF
ncbi:PEP-CTERM sorting domain-containing protein [Cylindrospermum sp. FACHB-282]|uniref:PEP-CTERM sorting domain-containing protein n=1 Tax=Cylindrospermum sp. FACHB-282 TaxID=2692794 RepID=UPI00168623E1|nr:PEP-CTERM sorting domain-containing protein [Cylindrospermum sp. FACHB-282]MBD2386027.1 PEP-CTERM sorting domain-containing protein [Cylindrospermum sp. FACHB-282]